MDFGEYCPECGQRHGQPTGGCPYRSTIMPPMNGTIEIVYPPPPTKDETIADLRARLEQAEQAFKETSDLSDELAKKLEAAERERDEAAKEAEHWRGTTFVAEERDVLLAENAALRKALEAAREYWEYEGIPTDAIMDALAEVEDAHADS